MARKRGKRRGRARGPNEGSLYQRADGRWVAELSLGHEGGKRRRKLFYGKTHEDALKKLNKARRERDQGLPIAGAGQTVGEFLNRWLVDCAQARLRPRTFEGYKKHVEQKIVPALGSVKLSALTGQQVQHFINELAKKHVVDGQEKTLAPRTVRYIRAVLRSALNKAVKWNLVARNVACMVDLPRVPKHEPQVLARDDARAFIRAAKNQRLGALFTVALSVGLRLGEAEGLMWSDVDLEKRSLRVSRALQRVRKEPGEKGTELRLVETKSDSSHRTIQLSQFAISELERHRGAQREERLKAGRHWQDAGLIFTNTIGTFVDERNLRREFADILTAAGLPHMRIHDLRHSCASLLLAEGTNIKVVQELLGHSQVSLTLDTYSHVIPGDREQAADKMDALLTDAQAEDTVKEEPDARGCQVAVKTPA